MKGLDPETYLDGWIKSSTQIKSRKLRIGD